MSVRACHKLTAMVIKPQKKTLHCSWNRHVMNTARVRSCNPCSQGSQILNLTLSLIQDVLKRPWVSVTCVRSLCGTGQPAALRPGGILSWSGAGAGGRAINNKHKAAICVTWHWQVCYWSQFAYWAPQNEGKWGMGLEGGGGEGGVGIQLTSHMTMFCSDSVSYRRWHRLTGCNEHNSRRLSQ